MPVESLRRARIKEMLAAFLSTPHKAKHLLVAIRKLVRIAMGNG